MIAALQNGETVKMDGLVNIAPHMKVGGKVNLGLRADRAVIAGLKKPTLWVRGEFATFRI